MTLTISVIVPTYRRPGQLAACLAGLAGQHRRPDEVLVVRRPDDLATAAAIAAAPLPVVEVSVHEPGVVAAMRAGAAEAAGEVIVFTDDDAVGRPDWLDTLVAHYADPLVGGVGGRDVLHPARREAICPSHRVGRLSRWGKQYGFHHVGTGPPVDVDVLKGVNMSFRREALALPERLLGDGAQVHNEVAVSLWASGAGWRLRYDPGAIVDHYSGPRFDADQRSAPAPEAVCNEAYNLVFTLLSFRPQLWWRRAAYGILVGDRATPGLVRALAAVVRRERGVAAKLGPSLRGQVRALRDVRRGHRVAMEPAPRLPR